MLIAGAYASAFHLVVQLRMETFAYRSRIVYLDTATHAVFRPALWAYERSTGFEVDVNPMVLRYDVPP